MKGTSPDMIGNILGCPQNSRPVEKPSPGVAVPDVARDASCVQVRKRSFAQVQEERSDRGLASLDLAAGSSLTSRLAFSYTLLTALSKPDLNNKIDHVAF